MTLDRLYAVLTKNFGPGPHGPDLTLREYIEDSISTLEFVLFIEDEFDLDLDREAEQITLDLTLAEVAALIERKLDAKVARGQ